MWTKTLQDIRENFFIYMIIFLVGVGVRIPFLEKFHTHWDGPAYTMALYKYSFIEKTPAEPGYPIYIGFGKFFHLFISDLHLSILAVSVLFSGIGAVTAFIVGRYLGNRMIGFIASLLFLSAPTIYYFGITANPYGILFTTTSLLALAVFMITVKNKKNGVLLGFAFSFALGIRPQDVLLLAPLFLYGFFALPLRGKLNAMLSLVAFMMIWLVPVILAVGGVYTYFSYVINFFENGPGVNVSPARLESIMPIIVKGIFQTLAISFIIPILFFCYKLYIFFLKRSKNKRQVKIIIFFAFWLLPPILFNIFIRSDHAAHQMAYLSGLLYITAISIWEVLARRKGLLIFVVCISVLFNIYTFFRIRDKTLSGPFVSQSYHYSEVTKNNIRMPAIIDYIRQFPANKTIVIVDPEIFRPFTYYLKQYRILAISALDTNELKIKDTVHIGFNWHYLLSLNRSHIFNFDRNINRIIVVPNNKNYSFNFNGVEKIFVGGNALIYSFPTDQAKKFHATIHEFKEIK